MRILFTFFLLFSLFVKAQAQPCPNVAIGVSLEFVSCATCSNGSATITVLGGNAPYMYNINYGFIPWVSSPTFNNLSMGTYTVEIYDTNSCYNVVSFAIMDSTSSSCLGFSGVVNTTDCTTAAICDGSAEVSFSSGNGQPYFQWGYNQIIVSTDTVATGLCPGYYTLHVADGQGCTSQTAVAIDYLSGGINNVVVVGNPTAGLSSLSTEWINGCAIDLSSLDTAYLVSANYGNTTATQDSLYTVWYLSDTSGASMQIDYVYYYPSSFGAINLILAVYCPFKSNPEFYNIVSTFNPNQSNIESNEFLHYFIYPNPAKDLITIENSSNDDLKTIELFDYAGKLIKRFEPNDTTLKLTDLTQGIYLLKISTAQGSFCERIRLE